MATPASYQWDLALCTVFQNEAIWLREWIEFYLLLGVQHFWLYNDRSDDHFRDVLRPYVARGVVEVIDRNLGPDTSKDHVLQGMVQTFNDGVARARNRAKWLICVDTDEFLFSPVEPLLLRFLERFESMPNVGAVCANWQMYGTAGVAKVPEDRLMIEVLNRKAAVQHGENLHVKSIVRPERVQKMIEQHHAAFHAPYTQVDSRGRPFASPWTKQVEVDLLRINHYFVRDERWVPIKVARRKRLFGESNPQAMPQHHKYNAVVDESIHAFVPALRRAMGFMPAVRGAAAAVEAPAPPRAAVAFDAAWFRTQYARRLAGWGLATQVPTPVLEQFFRARAAELGLFATATEAMMALDAPWYLAHYADLRQNGVSTPAAAVAHWQRHGIGEGRVANADILAQRLHLAGERLDAAWYLKHYVDLGQNGVRTPEQARRHWETHGRRENRSPNGAYDALRSGAK